MPGERRLVSRALGAAVLVSCLHVGSASAADPAPPRNVEGYVLSIEGGDVIVDLGATAGVSSGDVLELWRAIELVHPVTRKPVRDRYRVGTLRVEQVRDRLTVSVVEGTPKRPPTPGDTVLLRRAPEAPPASPGTKHTAAVPAAVPSHGAPPTDAETARVAELLESLKESPLVDRIRAYVAFVKKYPASPYARVLREDAVHYHRLLRAQLDTQAQASQPGSVWAPSRPASPAVAIVPEPRVHVEFVAPERALPGKPLDVGVHVEEPVAGAVLHVRSPAEVGYRPFPMSRAGGGHFRVTVPGDRIRPPELQYFVEVVDGAGHPIAAVGQEDSPVTTEVEKDPAVAPRALQERTTASLLSDYANFNTFQGKLNDWTFQTEGQLRMRFRDVGVRSLGTGFGVYRGVGGSLRELDELDLEPRKVGLTYGYLEGEFGFIPKASLITRLVCGLTEEGVELGGLALLRIGSDLGTNLSLGGEVLGGVGMRSITQLEIREVPRVPFLVRSEVSNQPAGTSAGARPDSSQDTGNLGLRTIVQVGYELSPGFVIALRGSTQGRSINHYGLGGGGALSYSW